MKCEILRAAPEALVPCPPPTWPASTQATSAPFSSCVSSRPFLVRGPRARSALGLAHLPHPQPIASSLGQFLLFLQVSLQLSHPRASAPSSCQSLCLSVLASCCRVTRFPAPSTPVPDSWKYTLPVELSGHEQLESSLGRDVASAGRNFHLPKGKCEMRGGKEAEALEGTHCVQSEPTPSNPVASRHPTHY